MRWILAVVAVAIVALGASALTMAQGSNYQTDMGTPCASPSPMTGSPVASPTMAMPMASPSASPTACASPSSGGGSAQTITMVDIAFQPNTLTIPANTDVTISLPNTGVTLHNFSIDELNIDVDVQPGQTGSTTINAPAGTYQFYCDVPGHKEAGMVGTLTVQ
jgi:plastocyanin